MGMDDHRASLISSSSSAREGGRKAGLIVDDKEREGRGDGKGVKDGGNSPAVPLPERAGERQRHLDRGWDRDRDRHRNRDLERDHDASGRDRHRERDDGGSSHKRSRGWDRDRHDDDDRDGNRNQRSGVRSGHRDRSRLRSKSPSSHRDRRDTDRNRDRRHSRSHDRHRRQSRSGSYTSRSSTSESYTASEDSSEEARRRRRKRRKERKEKERKKKDKKEKKKRKEKKTASGANFGKYGIIADTDIYTKEQEFHAWLMDIVGLSPETTPKAQMKKHFLKYMEDYNLGELPHEKYYNLEKWEAQQRDIRMGITPAAGNDGAFNLLNDEEQLRRNRFASRSNQVVPGVVMSQGQLQELNRVARERVEADRLRKMGFQPKASMGVRTESHREHRGY